jgi:anti-sigma factor RsiW
MLEAPLVLPRCEDVANRLSEFLDGELDDSASARVRLHLGLCSGCARLAADLATLVAALHRQARRDGSRSRLP